MLDHSSPCALPGRLLADISEPILSLWLWHQMGGDVQAELQA
jgi:hypothetical protein